MKLIMYRGDSAVFNLAAKQSDGTPLNLTTGTLYFTAKSHSRQADTDALCQKSSGTCGGITVTNASEGLFMVTLSPSDTVDAYAPSYMLWDVQYVTSGGNVYTLIDGTLLLKADITRSSSYL